MLENLRKKATDSAIVKKTKAKGERVILPGLEGMTIADFYRFFKEAYSKGNISMRGAAISFNVMLAILPLLLTLISIIPYVPIDNFQNDVLHWILDSMPTDLHNMFGDVLHDLCHQQHGLVLSISTLLTVYYASSSINATLSAFNKSYQVSLQISPIKRRMLSIVLLFGISILAAIAGIVSILGSMALHKLYAEGYLNSSALFVLIEIVKLAITFFLTLFAISTLYNAGNPDHKKFKLISTGTVLATVVVMLASTGFAYYAAHFGSYNKLYGSLGSIIVLLFWVYISARILLLGFELNNKTLDLKKAKQSSE